MPIKITKPDGTIIELTPDSYVVEDAAPEMLQNALDKLRDLKLGGIPFSANCVVRPVYPSEVPQ